MLAAAWPGITDNRGPPTSWNSLTLEGLPGIVGFDKFRGVYLLFLWLNRVITVTWFVRS